MKRLLIFTAALFVGSACATSHAKTPVERPPLEVPPPPPRMIEPAPPVPPPPEPVSDLPATPSNPRPRPPREVREAPKPETKPETQPATETPPATPPTTPVVPPLRTPTSVDATEAARRVKDVIDRANGTLGNVDFRRLNKEQQTQYNNVKLFIKQAQDAVKASNFELAQALAEKAEKLAKELPGR